VDESRDLLVARLKAGDRAAAAELVDIYYQQIYLFMRRLGHNRQTSEDLTQESFLQAWYCINQLKTGRILNGWLYSIATNISRVYWRRHKSCEETEIEGIDVPDGNEAADYVSRNEQLGQLKTALEKLPIKLKETVVLHYMQHLAISEAAAAAGIREGTFKSRLGRALEILRRQVICEGGKP
jgi:RNA polymerase sigma-70 factor (ECF subfamily)